MAGPAMSGMTLFSARCGGVVALAVMTSFFCAQAVVAQSLPSQTVPAEPEIQTPAAEPRPLPQAEPLPQAQPLPPAQLPQVAVPQVASPQVASPQDAPPRKPDGFFDAFNRWMDKSAKDFKASVDESNAKWREFGEKSEKAAKDAATAQKEAAEAFKNLSNVRIVEGRQTCAQAKNGSPDCQTAAEVICRGKGFGKGQSADIQTTRKCSAKAFLTRSEGDCRNETVVVKAACQ